MPLDGLESSVSTGPTDLTKTIFLCGSQAHVAASLACCFLAMAPKQGGQFLTTAINLKS